MPTRVSGVGVLILSQGFRGFGARTTKLSADTETLIKSRSTPVELRFRVQDAHRFVHANLETFYSEYGLGV